jgi:hypothetical protein
MPPFPAGALGEQGPEASAGSPEGVAQIPGVSPMARVLCDLYDAPVTEYPTSYAKDRRPADPPRVPDR